MTDIEIINAALASLGCETITALDDSSGEARVAKAVYPVTRDALLVLRQWTFAKSRLKLDQDPVPPIFGRSFRYALPNTALSVIRCYRGDGLVEISDWVREGGYILTDTEDPVYAELLLRVSEGGFHPVFIKALVAQLAADMAIPLTENRAVADSWETKAAGRLLEAAVADGKQGINEVIKPPRLPGRRR